MLDPERRGRLLDATDETAGSLAHGVRYAPFEQTSSTMLRLLVAAAVFSMSRIMWVRGPRLIITSRENLHVEEVLSMLCRGLILVFLAARLAACGHPADPNHTLERVRNGKLRAGVFPTASGKLPVREQQILQSLAKSSGAQLEVVRGGESELFFMLERGDIQLVIGGVSKKTPWKSRVGLTRPYEQAGNAKHSLVIAIPPGENGWLMFIEESLAQSTPTAGATER